MKPVLIIENSGSGMKLNENAKTGSNDANYVLEGVFTEFDVRNRNERVYTADEFIPHVNTMMEKKEWGAVYGEFDHPDVFDVSMKYVSHTIESATYNKEHNRLDGEIRLLSTQWGKEAKAIVNDGCPLFVSSRAAGITEGNGYVKIKQLFTYDIVADPGFSSARVDVKTMNESFGFKDESNIGIIGAEKQQLSMMSEKYDKSSNPNLFDLSDESKTNELFNMNKSDFITKGQLSDYSKYLTTEIKRVHNEMITKISESKGSDKIETSVGDLTGYYDALQEQQQKVIGYLDYLAEKITHSIQKNEVLEKKTDDIVNYTNYLAENVDKNIEYSNYLAENLDKSIDYSDYLAENLDKSIDYSNYLAENVDRNIEYSEYIAENVDKSIEYTNYLAENLDKSIDYSNYLAENLDSSIDYSDYLAENLDTTIGYTEYLTENLDATIGYTEYIAENLDKSIDYSDYISECIDKVMDYSNMISEKLNNTEEGGLINESFQSADEYLKENYKEEEELEEEDKTEEEEEENVNTEIEATTEENDVVSEEEETTLDVDSETKDNFKDFINDESSNEGLTTKIDKLIEEAKKREASKDQNPAFFAFLTPQDIDAFNGLEGNDQETVKLAMNESVGFYTRKDVLTIMQKSLETEELSPEQTALNGITDDVKEIWEKMDNKSKKSILSQTRFYDLSTENLVEHFWSTRTFNQNLINESKKLIDYDNPMANVNKMSDDDVEAFTKRFKHIK